MYKHYTKTFYCEEHPQGISEQIDDWLNSFQKDKPAGEYNFEIVGYAPLRSGIVVTVKVWEIQNDKNITP